MTPGRSGDRRPGRTDWARLRAMGDAEAEAHAAANADNPPASDAWLAGAPLVMPSAMAGREPPAPLDRYLALPWTWRCAWDVEGGAYLVTIAELPDYCAVGATEREAWVNARDALASLLAAYLARGLAIPAPAAWGAAARPGPPCPP